MLTKLNKGHDSDVIVNGSWFCGSWSVHLFLQEVMKPLYYMSNTQVTWNIPNPHARPRFSPSHCLHWLRQPCPHQCACLLEYAVLAHARRVFWLSGQSPSSHTKCWFQFRESTSRSSHKCCRQLYGSNTASLKPTWMSYLCQEPSFFSVMSISRVTLRFMCEVVITYFKYLVKGTNIFAPFHRCYW